MIELRMVIVIIILLLSALFSLLLFYIVHENNVTFICVYVCLNKLNSCTSCAEGQHSYKLWQALTQNTCSHSNFLT